MNIMKNLKFTKTHEWVKAETNEDYTIGITEHAQELLGDMVYIELPAIGTKIQAGQSFGVVESVKAASDVYAPVSGTVTEINTPLESNPALLNSDPYGQGWMIKIKPSQPEEINTLLKEEDYQQSILEH
jgi:glycine cleavage system H protein